MNGLRDPVAYLMRHDEGRTLLKKKTYPKHFAQETRYNADDFRSTTVNTA